MSTLEQYALSLYPNGLIDGLTWEDGFGFVVWITTPDHSTHAVSTKMMLVDAESDRHSRAMSAIRSQIASAMEVLK